jgi:hypothetical protein
LTSTDCQKATGSFDQEPINLGLQKAALQHERDNITQEMPITVPPKALKPGFRANIMRNNNLVTETRVE